MLINAEGNFVLFFCLHARVVTLEQATPPADMLCVPVCQHPQALRQFLTQQAQTASQLKLQYRCGLLPLTALAQDAALLLG